MALLVATATLTLLLVLADAAVGNAVEDLPDAQPTAWHEAAGLTPLLTAPPPPNPATICIIDTGVTPTPDLDITARWAYDGGTLDDVHATPDSAGHGTSVAHFAAGKVNGWGHAGAFPHGRIASVRVFPREGGAKWQDYIRAIGRCNKIDPNTKVIVISIGGQHIAPHEADELNAWIVRARRDFDANVVVAAGNGGGSADFPGRFAASFAVGASALDGVLCDFSARGPSVDLVTAGCGLAQAGWDGSTWVMHGTSYAAPIVAGALAAMRSYVPTLGPEAAERLLIDSARLREGGALLDASAALTAAGVPLPRPDVAAGAVQSPTPQAAVLAGASAPASFGGILPSGPQRLPRPEGHAQRTSRGITVLRIFNKPPQALVQVSGSGVRRKTASPTVRLRGAPRRLRVRFQSTNEPSAWTVVPVRRSARSSAFHR